MPRNSTATSDAAAFLHAEFEAERARELAEEAEQLREPDRYVEEGELDDREHYDVRKVCR
jgi:hypothetical protein